MLQEVYAQQQAIRSITAECERSVKKIKGEHIERISIEEKLKRENEIAALWTMDSLLWELYAPIPKFVYSLKLISSFNPVLFKHKKFTYFVRSLTMRVTDESGDPACLKATLQFSISVFHAKPPLRKLTAKRCGAGKQLLSGTKKVTVCGSPDVTFDDLRFMSITSKLRPKWVLLVVQCTNVPEIKPCLIEGVHVKSPSNYLPRYASDLFGPVVKTSDLCLG